MNQDLSFLTQEKYDELKKELHHLITVRRKEVAESLEYARSLGDLKENAEYAEARDTQGTVEDRIRYLESTLKTAKILTKKKSENVTMGSKVSIIRGKEKEVHTYTIVGPDETNMLERKLSHLSPLGSALMGKRKGEEFSFETPNGKQKYTIVSID